MPRFFLEPEALSGEFAVLTGENAAHARVLRLTAGDAVTLCDGRGLDCVGVVSDVSPGCISVVLQKKEPSASEPSVFYSVYMAFPKSDKLEHVIQKATELGAAEIIAFPSARCVSRPDEKSLRKKLERWQKIAESAAGQSGRGRIPTVEVVPSYAAALERAARADLPLFFYENERARTLRQTVEATPHGSVSIVTGPEGGFDAAEVAQAEAAGLHICSLGTRILRCETAPLCALSALLYADHAL